MGLVGASGSGKSTLNHALADSLAAGGTPVAHVPQSPEEGLDPLRRLEFHWRQAERALGLGPDPDRRRALLGAMGLAEAPLGVRPWGWSRGMRQRFVIAMAFLGRPRLLILDEPTSTLDPVVAATTMELLGRHLAEHDMALLLVTPDLGLAARRVDRLLVMEAGRVVEDAACATLLAAPRTAAVRRLVAHRSSAALPC